MKQIQFVFGVHNSQPVGTPSEHVETAYQSSYKPTVRLFYNDTTVPVTLHYSGVLLSWLEEHHSEFMDVLSELVSAKKVELLGGGFYDPVLSLIPRADRLGQIESMTTFLRKRFGRRPRGAWITEHVWEPALASTLKNSGMDYIFLDDNHFLTGGLIGEGLMKPCLTEDQGKTIVVFPISHTLRGYLLREPPERLIEELAKLASNDQDCVVCMIYEGERFGYWANSYDTEYSMDWLRRFLQLVEENSDWLVPTLPSRYLKAHAPKKRAYFPSTSYDEMMYWVLTPDRQRSFDGLRARLDPGENRNGYLFGGFFRQFLTRYPESNLLYAKMQYTHVLVNQIRGDKYRKQTARDELWKGQCHNAYWHGRPGGLYLNHLRKHAYASLIEAEKITREKGIFIPSIISLDFDMDGQEEYLFQGHDINAYVHRRSGHLLELDYLPASWNYLDTLGRRPESYHGETEKARGYDSYPRKAFIDHFFDSKTTIEDFSVNQYRERSDFVGDAYTVKGYNRNGHELGLAASGLVETEAGRFEVTLEKTYRFRAATVSVDYRIENGSREPLELIFGSEVNLAFVSASVSDLRIYVEGEKKKLDEIGPEPHSVASARSVRFEDMRNSLALSLSLSEPAELWSLPIETAAKSPMGIKVYYQGSCALPRWRVSVEPGQSKSLGLILEIGKR
jgi:alpha-amylase